MIGKTLHIKNSFFRMLPNPTPYRWEDKSFSLRRLLRSFKHAIADDELSQKCEHMHSIQEHIVAIETHSRRPAPRQQGPGQQQQQQTPMNLALLDSLHAALDCCDNYLRQEFPAWFVLMILRIHIEEVLKNLNTPPGGKSGKKGHGAEPLSAVSGRHPSLAQHVLGSGSSSSSGRGRGCHGSRSSSRSPSNSDSSSSSNSSDSSDESHLRPPTFADLDAATTDIKQDLFMQIYFDVIRPRVLEQYKVPRRVGTTQYVRLMAANAAPVAANSNEGLPPFHHHNHAGFFDNHHIRQPSASSLPASVALRGSTSPTPTPEPPQQPERVATAATTAAAGPSTTASTPPAVAVSGPTPSSSTPAVTGPAADMHCDSSSASGPSPHAHPGLPHAHTTPLLLAAQQPAAAGGGSSNTVVETMHGVTLQPLLTPTTSLGPRGPLGHRRQVPSMAGSLDDTRSLMDGLGSGGGGGQSGRSSRAAFMMIGDGTGCDVEEMDIRANSVWCTLVFRSLCWLMLHDFHRRDVQLPGISELWGSRLPVYIG